MRWQGINTMNFPNNFIINKIASRIYTEKLTSHIFPISIRTDKQKWRGCGGYIISTSLAFIPSGHMHNVIIYIVYISEMPSSTKFIILEISSFFFLTWAFSYTVYTCKERITMEGNGYKEEKKLLRNENELNEECIKIGMGCTDRYVQVNANGRKTGHRCL